MLGSAVFWRQGIIVAPLSLGTLGCAPTRAGCARDNRQDAGAIRTEFGSCNVVASFRGIRIQSDTQRLLGHQFVRSWHPLVAASWAYGQKCRQFSRREWTLDYSLARRTYSGDAVSHRCALPRQ